jgi:hypothetical protein
MPSTTADPGAERSTGRSRRAWLLGLLVVLVAAAAGLAWYLGRDTPAAVDTQAAIDAATSGDDAAAEVDPADGADEGGEAVEAASSGGGDDADAQGDEAAGTATTVRCPAPTGSIAMRSPTTSTPARVVRRVPDRRGAVDRRRHHRGRPDPGGRRDRRARRHRTGGGVVTADLTVLRTDISQRDNRVQGALDTATHPTTTFELTEPVDLGTIPPVGEPVSVTAVGELTLHGVTRPVTVPLDAVVLSGVSALLVTGSFEIELADYDIVAPSAPIVVSVADTGTVELQLYLAPA